MQFKEHDKVTIKISNTDSVTGEIVHVGQLSKHYYVSAGQHSGYYEEHELSALYPLQKNVTYFNVDPLKLHEEQHRTFAEEIEEWAEVANTTTPDSTKAATGSLRFNTGKPQTNEIDPSFILGMGEVLTRSRSKYPAFNWQKDTPFSVPYDSAMRHLMAFQAGDDIDKESQCHHLLHVATNIMFLYYHYNNKSENDDRGFKNKNNKIK
jgi:Domain of unknown function (DUF5664)